MYATLTYTETPKSLTIDVRPNRRAAVSMGLFIRGAVLLITAVLGTLMLVTLIGDLRRGNFWVIPLTLIPIAMGVISYWAFVSFIKRGLAHEHIVVTPEELVVVERAGWMRKERAYELDGISALMYDDRENFTPHPMVADGSFDITGLGAGEAEVQYIIREGKLSFVYDGEKRRFGRDVDEDEAEEMIQRIERFTGKHISAGRSMAASTDEEEPDKDTEEA